MPALARARNLVNDAEERLCKALTVRRPCRNSLAFVRIGDGSLSVTVPGGVAMNLRTVNFFSEETRMEGDLFLPSDLKAGERRPGIVLCHGFTGVRTLILGDYAKAFADAGFVALTFDYRGYGGSEGIRRRLIPMEQIDDIRNAINFFETLSEVDSDRIGLWGTSFGGANAPYAAAVDTRIKAVVGQVGFGDGERFLLDTRRFGERAELLKNVADDRRRRAVEGAGGSAEPARSMHLIAHRLTHSLEIH